MGATGLVGQTILRVLEERQVAVETIIPLATAGSGRTIEFAGRAIPVEPVASFDWARAEVCFLAAGNQASEQYRPLATGAGVTVIDKASRYRMDPIVPLVVPEVNMNAVGDHLYIASPNCSTIQMVVALGPIRQRWGLQRVVVSTYQAVSGSGREAMHALTEETRQALAGQPVAPSVYPTQIAQNCLAYCDQFGDDGYTGEEWKLIRETQKIFEQPVAVAATAVRVPVYVGHSESIYVETVEPFELPEIRSVLAAAPSVRLVDDPAHGVVPTALDAAGQDDVLVGRLRRDPFVRNGLHLWVVADNLRKGAATNAIQIMDALRQRWT